MIFLQTHSGLANRIRVIVSGLAFSAEEGQPLIIYWNKDMGLNCDFYDLFKRNEKLDVRQYDVRLLILERMKNKGILKFIFDKLYQVDFSLFDIDFKKYVWNKNTDNIDKNLLPKTVRNYYIKACHEFSFDAAYLKYLNPVKSVQDLINQEVIHFPEKITGIHIRRTDNDKSIEESPVNLFIERIIEDLDEDPSMHYFLATDDQGVEKELMDLFPSRILKFNKEFSRASKEGIIGAMVDMYCLAATSKIYGSYWSSFSYVAAKIGNIPLVVIKK